MKVKEGVLEADSLTSDRQLELHYCDNHDEYTSRPSTDYALIHVRL